MAVAAAAMQSGKTPAPSAAAQTAYFESKVRPILQAACVPCHGGGQPSGGLALTSRAAALKGGVSGPSMTPGKASVSLLIKAVNHDGRKMPPQGKLPQSQIDVLTKWVSMGAPWPDEKPGFAAAPATHGPPPVNAETMRFWSFQPVKSVTPPQVKRTAWVHNPIDRFVLAKNQRIPRKHIVRAVLFNDAQHVAAQEETAVCRDRVPRGLVEEINAVGKREMETARTMALLVALAHLAQSGGGFVERIAGFGLLRH